jgi:hypothetical protein
VNVYDAITLAIAATGAVLGIMNTWQQMSKDRVRLKVTPAHALPVGRGRSGDWTLSIDVVNLSAFPVTVDEVGLELVTKQHLVNTPTTTANGGALPVRLEPREALTVLCYPELKLHPRLREVRAAYVRCQCGTVRYGTSPALKQLVREAGATRHGRGS